MTPGASAKTPGGAAAGRPAAFLAEPGPGVRSCIGGALEERPFAGGGDGGGGGVGECVGVGAVTGERQELRPAGPSREGGRARGQRRSSPMGAAAGTGEAAASASPGQGEGQGEGESSILHIRLPSPTKLASKHFRQSPVANSQNSTIGPYDA